MTGSRSTVLAKSSTAGGRVALKSARCTCFFGVFVGCWECDEMMAMAMAVAGARYSHVVTIRLWRFTMCNPTYTNQVTD